MIPVLATAALMAALIRPPVICIDPGHPSEVGSGCAGKRLTEVHVAWNVANRLATILRGQGYRVVLTKSREGQMVRNRRRAEIANRSHAALLLRLHCDAADVAGVATFYPTRQGTVDGVRGPSGLVLKQCGALAPRFHRAVVAALAGKLADRGFASDDRTAVGGRQGALTGSIYSTVPVVLVEMCTLTLPHDEAFMASPGGPGAMAAALAAGVRTAVRPPTSGSTSHVSQ